MNDTHVASLSLPLRSSDEPAQYGEFATRHIGPSPGDLEAMLAAIGVPSLEELIAQSLPQNIRVKRPLALPDGLSETEALDRLRTIASKNEVFTSLIGLGYYGTITPLVIQRNVLENPAWYTAYTPYQPEISQGRLEALLNFQTMVCDLTGLDIANASLLDEGTAAAEAMALAKRVARSESNVFFVDVGVHPQTLAVLRTRAQALGWIIECGDASVQRLAGTYFGALFQYPGTFGALYDFRSAIQAVRLQGGLAVVAADPLALTLLVPPGELGADIAIGSMQRFGVPMGYGGPHAAYIAVKEAHKRELPGRLVSVSVDAQGQQALRLGLQTREQHIRREKATSNICTAQVLLAVIAAMYAVYHGPDGLERIARRVHHHASVLAAGLKRLGFKLLHEHFFDTVTVLVPKGRGDIIARAQAERLNLRLIAPGECSTLAALGIALDETTTPATVEAVSRSFGGTLLYAEVRPETRDRIPGSLQRQSVFLQHPVFHRYRSETELLRYLRRLSDRDLALDRTMIPLGSCTMKLNATAEMLPISWPDFNALHPFAPSRQAMGYHELTEALKSVLCEITGYDAVSLQPNSGAQGEYAGLLAIRAYHRSRGDAHRTVCLIPASAHGTNPASAKLAGMEVVIVNCDARGNIDLGDLKAKAERQATHLAAIMVTYPSTHGVFEEEIRSICTIVHEAGGQVYVDGANLNAQVGLARPGDYGADVSHLNLHKTFCIPHGGGGPGMGPIGVKAHLAAFLPGHPLEPLAVGRVGPVSAAPYGSASILPISYMYVLLMGARGLKRATEAAIVAANYIAARLGPHFPVLYKNAKGRVAHECIIDPRGLQKAVGVTVDDIAKRLIDYGFHAPTMSFPVPGTLMIEPTESESKAELERFCEAMIAIRQEIRDIEEHRLAIADSPLRHAPHTARNLVQETWRRPYSRAVGCFPAEHSSRDKYWPPVGRIDHVHGDRNLFCSCPPMDPSHDASAASPRVDDRPRKASGERA
jgi:glycine dehydrogenase